MDLKFTSETKIVFHDNPESNEREIIPLFPAAITLRPSEVVTQLYP